MQTAGGAGEETGSPRHPRGVSQNVRVVRLRHMMGGGGGARRGRDCGEGAPPTPICKVCGRCGLGGRLRFSSRMESNEGGWAPKSLQLVTQPYN